MGAIHAVTAFRGRPRGRIWCTGPGAAAVRFIHPALDAAIEDVRRRSRRAQVEQGEA